MKQRTLGSEHQMFLSVAKILAMHCIFELHSSRSSPSVGSPDVSRLLRTPLHSTLSVLSTVHSLTVPLWDPSATSGLLSNVGTQAVPAQPLQAVHRLNLWNTSPVMPQNYTPVLIFAVLCCLKELKNGNIWNEQWSHSCYASWCRKNIWRLQFILSSQLSNMIDRVLEDGTLHANGILKNKWIFLPIYFIGVTLQRQTFYINRSVWNISEWVPNWFKATAPVIILPLSFPFCAISRELY